MNISTHLPTLDQDGYEWEIKQTHYDAIKEQTTGKVAIRKGCPNKQCFCTGVCQEIIGWRDKLPNEYETRT